MEFKIAFTMGWEDGADGTAAETVNDVQERYCTFTSDEISAYLAGVAKGQAYAEERYAKSRGD